MSPKTRQKQDLEQDVTYLLCPDNSCKLFYDTNKRIPCERNCPKLEELIKIIVCHNCCEMIELAGNHLPQYRVDHDCPDGRRAANFRMSGKYQLIYEKPKYSERHK